MRTTHRISTRPADGRSGRRLRATLGTIALAAAVGFSTAACQGTTSGSASPNQGGDSGLVSDPMGLGGRAGDQRPATGTAGASAEQTDGGAPPASGEAGAPSGSGTAPAAATDPAGGAQAGDPAQSTGAAHPTAAAQPTAARSTDVAQPTEVVRSTHTVRSTVTATSATSREAEGGAGTAEPTPAQGGGAQPTPAKGGAAQPTPAQAGAGQGGAQPVNDATMQPFVGVGEGGELSVAVSPLGVVVITDPSGGATVFQAQSVRGNTFQAKATFSTRGVPVGRVSTFTFTEDAGTLSTDRGTSFSFSTGAPSIGFDELVRSWAGHGRGMQIAKNGQVKLSQRGESPDAPPQTAEGFLVSPDDGTSQAVLIYLSRADGYQVGKKYPISISNGVVDLDGTKFCGDSNPDFVCGA